MKVNTKSISFWFLAKPHSCLFYPLLKLSLFTLYINKAPEFQNGNGKPLNMKLEESQTLLPIKNQEIRGIKSTSLFNRNRKRLNYKLWVLAAVLLLALASMLTGSVSIKGTGLFKSIDAEFGSLVGDDLDILEVEEREKIVRRMWVLYGRVGGVSLPRFWREAFEAAYEFLVSESVDVRNAAVSDIAKLSLVKSFKP